MSNYQLIQGDCLQVLPTLPSGSVQCCITSPPYFRLRNYQVDGQIGLEASPAEFVEKMVMVFREVRRVLKDNGVLWLVIGDSYVGNPASGGQQSAKLTGGEHKRTPKLTPHKMYGGLPPKNLIGIPWRVAFALQADGWILRSDCIWSKPNPMPESVTDRPTRSHEYIFLLSKSERYFYDGDAIKEPAKTWTGRAATFARSGAVSEHVLPGQSAAIHRSDRTDSVDSANGRNKRSVWEVATHALKASHFATFPPKLIEPCILAGTPAYGVCPECQAPYERVIEKPDMTKRPTRAADAKMNTSAVHVSNGWEGYPKSAGQAYQEWRNANPDITTGWKSTCICNAGSPIPATVLDCFSGAGTTGLVSIQHGRRYIGIELNPDYIEMTKHRLERAQPSLLEALP